MTKTAERNLTPSTTGLVLHEAARYDLLVWLVTLGREQVFREKLLRLARLKPGEAVLDVGCGTGTLAIAAKRHVGPTGTVYGIDAAPEMIARADKKARKAGVEIVFKNGFAQSLPFPDAQFDVVLTTLMLHHLPRKARQELAVEMRRVLKPGGRVLAIDFGEPSREKRSLLSHVHRHGHIKLRDIIDVLSEAGLNSVESGAVGIMDLQFVLAVPLAARDHGDCDQRIEAMKGHSRLLTRTWMLPVGVVVFIAGPIILYYLLSHTALLAAVVSGGIILMVITHLGLLGVVVGPMYALFRRRPRQ